MGKEKLLDTIKRLGKVSGATDKLKDAQNAAGTSLPIYTEREGQKIKMTEVQHPDGRMSSYPPVELWDDWQEYDGKLWPQKVARHYSLVPTICFNCESGCGLLAYVDKDTFEVRKFEGNPAHPGSRGRNCAKGPATHNQIYDPERILYPLKRVGKRGEGKWERISWDQALEEVGAKCEKAGKSATMASCTTSADPVKIILPTAPLPLGALMATTATPIFARRARALVIGFGALLTDRVLITPMPK